MPQGVFCGGCGIIFSMSVPMLLAADTRQNMFDVPGFAGCGQSGNSVRVLSGKDLMPMPEGSRLFFLPDRHPVAFDMAADRFITRPDLLAVAAFLPPGYTLAFTVAYQENRKAKTLPLYAYAPVVFYKEELYVPAVRVDSRKVHDITCLDQAALKKGMREYKDSPNRLIRHLANCATTNFCPNAINFFLGKYEAPLPTSPSCNASCLGCISFQPKGSCAATQERLSFVPTADEIAGVALDHIRRVPRAIVSFGQGCEGEPLLSFPVIREAIMIIRKKTRRGTIHMNTNASLPDRIDALCKAGLDSVRVSINSARKEFYHRYYTPRGYGFADVLASIKAAKRHKKFVALNYLVMPGFTDTPDEFKAFVDIIHKTRVDMIQWRNLNYDPQRYFKSLKVPDAGGGMGMRVFMQKLKKKFPKLRYGYFNVPQ